MNASPQWIGPEDGADPTRERLQAMAAHAAAGRPIIVGTKMYAPTGTDLMRSDGPGGGCAFPVRQATEEEFRAASPRANPDHDRCAYYCLLKVLLNKSAQ